MTDEPRVEIAPCPMPGCGGPVRIVPQRVHGLTYGHSAACVDCDYRFGLSLPTREEAIAAHNALCADVRRGREAEARIKALEDEVNWRREEMDRADKRMSELRLSLTHLEDTIDLLGTSVSSLAAERDALRAEVERLRGALVALRDARDCATLMERWSQINNILNGEAALDAGGGDGMTSRGRAPMDGVCVMHRYEGGPAWQRVSVWAVSQDDARRQILNVLAAIGVMPECCGEVTVVTLDAGESKP